MSSSLAGSRHFQGVLTSAWCPQSEGSAGLLHQTMLKVGVGRTETAGDRGRLSGVGEENQRPWTQVLGGLVGPTWSLFLPTPFTLLGTLPYPDLGSPVGVKPAESWVSSLESCISPL